MILHTVARHVIKKIYENFLKKLFALTCTHIIQNEAINLFCQWQHSIKQSIDNVKNA